MRRDRLDVYAEREGSRRLVGTLEFSAPGRETFTYAQEWLSAKAPHPISLSLPLQSEVFTSESVSPYFDGLLPEEGVRSDMARHLRKSPELYIRLLERIGREPIGAVSFGPEDSKNPQRYEPIPLDFFDRLAAKPRMVATESMVAARLSLAGAQPKIGLYRAKTGDWYQPLNGAPSTHILKPAHRDHPDIAINEAICLLAARKSGLPAAPASLIPASDPILCSQRFDRTPSGVTLDGQVRPARLHHEDFAQALGYGSDRKYESGDDHLLRDIVELLTMHSVDPIADIEVLWLLVIFNFLIGNCDAHLKNISLLRSSDWSTIGLAPFYDLLNTTGYGYTREMSMAIGGERDIDAIDRGDFAREATALGLDLNWALRHVDRLLDRVPQALDEAADQFVGEGFSDAEVIGERIAAEVYERSRAIRSR